MSEQGSESRTNDLLRFLVLLSLDWWKQTIGRDGWERAKNPMPGDLVVEMTTAFRARDPMAQIPQIGILLRVADEPWPDWNEAEEERPAPLETVYYVRPLDGTVNEFRWVNASFISPLSEAAQMIFNPRETADKAIGK